MKAALLRALACMTLAVAWLASPADAADRILWTDETESALAFANLDGSGGGELGIVGTMVADPEGVAIDAAAGRIYWVNYGGPFGNRISSANLDGSGGTDLNTTGATVLSPYGIAIDPIGGKVFWANAPGGPDDISFARIDGSGGGNLDTTGATELNSPLGVAVDPAAGRVYWTNYGNEKISYANIDGSGGGADVNTTGATVKRPVGLAVDSAAGRVYWANDHLDAGISYANLDGSGGGDLNTTGATLNNPVGVAIDTEAGRIYWANSELHVISFARLDGSGGGDLNTTGAPTGEANFPALLKQPRPAGPPAITVDPAPGSLLSCSQGTWAADEVGAFLYRAPQSLAYQWSRDGTSLLGATTNTLAPHSVGNYSCTVTATNAAGSVAQASGSRAIERANIRKLSIKPRSLVAAARGPSALAGKPFKRRKPGATVSFRLNEGAMVAFKVKQRRRARGGRHARFVKLPGGFNRVGKAGRNSFRYTGRLRKHRLRPGRYLLLATPTGVGRAGRTRSTAFRVTEPAR